MQFIAEDPVHVVVRLAGPALHDTHGRMITHPQRALYAKFERGAAPAWAIDVALQHFEFRKKPQDISVNRWVAYYDSIEDQVRRGWTDEERKAIEDKLVNHHDSILVETPRMEKPWPLIEDLRPHGRRTPELSADKLYETAITIGVDAATVAAYLRQEEWDQRVIDAFVAKIEAPAVSDEELVEA